MTSAFGDLDLHGLLGEEPFVRNLARSLLFDEHQVDDVVQQTWVAAMKASRGSRSWLASVVRSRASNVRRDAQRVRDREHAGARVETLPSTSELLEREELRRNVVEAVGALPEKYRVVVLLRFYEGLPPRKIATELGVNRDTVATRLKRGLAMLRERLDASHDGNRQRWALGLVPLAVPLSPKSAAVALVAKAGVWMLAMKQWVFVAAGLAVVLIGWGVAADWFGTEPEEPDFQLPQVQAATGDVEEPVESTVDDVDAGSASRVVVDETARSGGLPSSVHAALCGFRGRVVGANGEPAADELVRLIGIDPVHTMGSVFDPDGRGAGFLDAGPSSRSVRTDEDGVFLIEGAHPDAIYALHAGVDGDDPTWSMLQRTAGPAEIIDLGTITLVQKGAITGRVVDEEGEPVVGADVWSADIPGGVMSVAPVDRLQPGGAVFVAVPRIEFSVDSPDAIEAYHKKLRRHFASRVTESNDDTEFLALDLPGWFNRVYRELPVARTTTDGDGAFTLRGVPKGSAALVVTAPGYLNGGKPRVLVKPGVARDVGELELKEGNVCGGVVRDEAGTPLSGAQVRVAARPSIGLTGVLFGGFEATVDAEGRFEVTGLPRDEIFVAARRGVGQPWTVHGPYDPDDEDIEITFEALRDVKLEVASSADDVSLENVRVAVRRGPPLGELTVLGLQPELPARRTADADGVTVHGLEPGKYTFQVSADGHAIALAVVDLGEANATCSVELQPVATTALRVVDSAGAPIEGAQVFAQSVETPGWGRSVLFGFGSIRGWNELARFVGFSDAAGELAIDVLPAGKTSICVRHPAFGAGFASVELPVDETVIELEEPGVVHGTLYDGGKPASSDKHRLVAKPVSIEMPMPSAGGQAVPDAQGQFRFEGLAKGRYDIEVEESLADVKSLGDIIDNTTLGYSFSWGRDREVRVEVEAGGEHEVVFDVDPDRTVPGTGGFLRIRVTVDGQPAVGYRVKKGEWGNDALGELDASGSLLSDELVSQTYWFTIQHPTNFTQVWRREVSIEPTKESFVEVELTTGKVRGRVLRPNGLPAAKHSVSLVGILGDGANSNASGMTDDEGRYELTAMAGTYTLWCNGLGGKGQAPDLVVPAGGIVAPDMTLSPEGVLAGRVEEGQYTVSYITVATKDGSASWMYSIRDGTFAITGLKAGEYTVEFLDREMDEHEAIPATLVFDEAGMLDQVFRVGPPK